MRSLAGRPFLRTSVGRRVWNGGNLLNGHVRVVAQLERDRDGHTGKGARTAQDLRQVGLPNAENFSADGLRAARIDLSLQFLKAGFHGDVIPVANNECLPLANLLVNPEFC